MKSNMIDMKNRHSIIPVIILCMTCAPLRVDAETLRGTIKDAITGEPLVGATVKVVELQTGAVADMDGSYSVVLPRGGRFTIESSYIGYEPSVSKEVLVVGVKEVVLNIELREDKRQLTEVVVRPRVNKEAMVNPTALAGGVMLSMEEATRFAGGANDPARLVTAYAGVSGTNGGNGISVHGNAPIMMKYRIEGVEVFTPNHFNDFYEANFGMVSALNANVIGNSDFYTSTFNANYSNSLSGVFDVKMRNGNNSKFEHLAQIGTVSEELTSEGPLSSKHRASYIVNYRYGFTSLADKLGLIGEQDTQYDFQDFSVKLNFPTAKVGTFSAFALGYYDSSVDKPLDIVDVETIYDASSQDGHLWGLLGGITHRIHFNSGLTWRTTVGYNAQHIKADLGYWGLKRDEDNALTMPVDYDSTPHKLYPYSTMKMNEDRIVLNTEFSKQVTPVWLTQFGVDYSHRIFELSYSSNEYVYERAPFTSWLNAKGSTDLGSIFWQNILKPTDSWSINIGVNGSYFAFSDELSVEPRLSAKYDINESNTLSFGYGLHSMIERMDAYYYEEDGKRLNDGLGFTKAHHVLATYMHKFSGNLNFRISGYYQYGFNTPVGSAAGSTFCSVNRLWNIFDEAMVNKGNTRNYGGDVTLEHYMSDGFFGQVNVSVFKSEYKALDTKWRPQLYDRRFMVKILGGKEWMVGKNKQNVFNVSAKYSVQGGLRYTPMDIDLMIRLMEQGDIPNEPYFKDDEAMSKQFDPEHVVDLTISFKLNKAKVSHTFAFEGLNILMSESGFGQRFLLRERKAKVEEDGISLPNIFYRIDF